MRFGSIHFQKFNQSRFPTQYLPGEVLVGELCDADVGKHGQSVLDVVWFPLDASQHTDAAKDALRKGASHNL